jgi:hypothetical protein
MGKVKGARVEWRVKLPVQRVKKESDTWLAKKSEVALTEGIERRKDGGAKPGQQNSQLLRKITTNRREDIPVR